MDREARERITPRSAFTGAAAASLVIAATTLLIFPLKDVAPVLSLGVLYLLGVLFVSARWGLLLGIATGVVSALAFNFFHIPPTGRFSIAQAENLVGLAVFVAAAVIAAELSQRARRRAVEADDRRREADLAGEMARLLLRGEDLDGALAVASHRLAQALGLPSSAIEEGVIEPGERRLAFPLREGPAQIGTLLVPKDTSERSLRRLQERVVPALEAVLAAALERDALLGNRIEAEALRRTDTLKTALLRAVSHDLRSPLTAIIAAAEPLRSRSITDDERDELAGVISEEALRLSRLIDNLLDLSRLEAGAAPPRLGLCNLADVIEAAVEELRPAEGELLVKVPEELPPIRADAAQLQRAFVNLLENAIRNSGGHSVLVRAHTTNNRLLVRVVDRGPGIPSAQQERVFEPFYRSGTDETGHRGSGLGLAIVRGFVEVNDGRIWVESLPKQGTSFVLEFHAAAATEAAPARAGADVTLA
jgi:two-component system sensor histidine kinase KdpD